MSGGSWEEGFSAPNWPTCRSREVFGRDCRSAQTGVQSAPARWCKNLSPGLYGVRATWLPSTGAAQAARYTVLVGSTAVSAPVLIDQRKPPVGITDLKRVWQDIGSLQLAGTEEVCVQLDVPTEPGKNVSADGIRFERLDLAFLPIPGGGNGAPQALDSVEQVKLGEWEAVTLRADGEGERPMVFQYQAEDETIEVRPVDADPWGGTMELEVRVHGPKRAARKLRFAAAYDERSVSNVGTVTLQVGKRRRGRNR